MNSPILRPIFLTTLLLAGMAVALRGADDPGIVDQWSGVTGGPSSPVRRTLETTAEWDAFWRSVDRPAPRALDPARERAVLIALGQRRSGGYRVAVTAALVRDDRLVVRYREDTPPPDARAMQMLTTPWTIAIVRRAGKPVTFEREPAAAADAGRVRP